MFFGQETVKSGLIIFTKKEAVKFGLKRKMHLPLHPGRKAWETGLSCWK